MFEYVLNVYVALSKCMPNTEKQTALWQSTIKGNVHNNGRLHIDCRLTYERWLEHYIVPASRRALYIL